MSESTIEPWDCQLRARTRGDAYWQIIMKAEEIPFLSMLSKEAQRGLVHSLVDQLHVLDHKPENPEYEYAVSINLIPTGEGWVGLNEARKLLPKWQEQSHNFGIGPEAFRIIRRRKAGTAEVAP